MKLIILQTEWFAGTVNKFVEIEHYEVDARLAGKSYVFTYGQDVRKVVPRLSHVTGTPHAWWHIAETGGRNHDTRHYYAYTAEGFARRAKRPTLADIQTALVDSLRS